MYDTYISAKPLGTVLIRKCSVVQVVTGQIEVEKRKSHPDSHHCNKGMRNGPKRFKCLNIYFEHATCSY